MKRSELLAKKVSIERSAMGSHSGLSGYQMCIRDRSIPTKIVAGEKTVLRIFVLLNNSTNFVIRRIKH